VGCARRFANRSPRYRSAALFGPEAAGPFNYNRASNRPFPVFTNNSLGPTWPDSHVPADRDRRHAAHPQTLRPELVQGGLFRGEGGEGIVLQQHRGAALDEIDLDHEAVPGGPAENFALEACQRPGADLDPGTGG
jgi:hypothetical protein